jgi:hypothetical protein
MPKQTRKSRKKVVASKSGRRISTPVGILIVLVAGLFLAVAGTYGYTKYKERDLQAKAAKWKQIVPPSIQRNGGDGIKFVGCRQYTEFGPDNQQNKKIAVTILASKPKSLKNNNPNYKDPLVFVNRYKEDPSQGDLGKTAYKWWNDELAQVRLEGLKVNDSLVIHVWSDLGAGIAGSSQLNFDDPNVKPSDRIIYHISGPTRNFYKSDKAYQNAVKAFKKKTISVAQLPSCT